MHVGIGISAQQGLISISETKNHMGQGLGNTQGGGGAGGGRTITFSFFENALIIAEV